MNTRNTARFVVMAVCLVVLAHPFYAFPHDSGVTSGLILIFRDFISGLAGLVLAVTGRSFWRQERPTATSIYGIIAAAGATVGAYTVQAYDAVLTSAYVGLWPLRITISVAALTIATALWVGTGTIIRHTADED